MNKTQYVVEYYNKTTNDYGTMLTETPIYDREVALDLGQRSIKAMLEQYGYEVYFRVMMKVSANSAEYDEDDDEFETNEEIEKNSSHYDNEFVENCRIYYEKVIEEMENTCWSVKDNYHFMINEDTVTCNYTIQYRMPFSSNKLHISKASVTYDEAFDNDEERTVAIARALCRALNNNELSIDDCDSIINDYIEEHE